MVRLIYRAFKNNARHWTSLRCRMNIAYVFDFD